MIACNSCSRVETLTPAPETVANEFIIVAGVMQKNAPFVRGERNVNEQCEKKTTFLSVYWMGYSRAPQLSVIRRKRMKIKEKEKGKDEKMKITRKRVLRIGAWTWLTLRCDIKVVGRKAELVNVSKKIPCLW